MPLLAENAEYSIAEICDVQFYTHSINSQNVSNFNIILMKRLNTYYINSFNWVNSDFLHNWKEMHVDVMIKN